MTTISPEQLAKARAAFEDVAFKVHADGASLYFDYENDRICIKFNLDEAIRAAIGAAT